MGVIYHGILKKSTFVTRNFVKNQAANKGAVDGDWDKDAAASAPDRSGESGANLPKSLVPFPCNSGENVLHYKKLQYGGSIRK